jgi:hypothetical protein
MTHVLEICSAHPTSGGPYFWAAMIAKPQSAPFASWITGWFNLLGQVAITTGIRCVADSPPARLRPSLAFHLIVSHAPLSSPPHVPLAQISSPALERLSGSMPQSCSPKVSVCPSEPTAADMTTNARRHNQYLWRAHPQVPEQRLRMVARARYDLARHRHSRRGAEAPERQVRLPDVHRRHRRLVGAREPRLRRSDRHSHGSIHANRSV